MRVLFLSPNGQPAGPRARIYNFARRLASRGVDVTIFCKSHFHGTSNNKLSPIEPFRKEQIEGFTVVWINSGVYSGNGLGRFISEFRFCWRAYRLALSISSEDRADIVIGDSVTPMNSATAALIARKAKARFVHQIRDIWPAALVADGSLKHGGVAYWFFRALERFSYRSCDWICSALPHVAAHVEAAGGDPTRITYIRNGVDLEETYNASLSATPRQGFNITYVGTISHAHDVISIVEGFSLFLGRNPAAAAALHIYGDGIKRSECEAMAQWLKLDNAHFHGMIDKDEVPAVLAQADLLVVAILESKAYQFGANLNKMYDYFASGRPVLLSGRIPNDDVQTAACGLSVPGQSPQLVAQAMETVFRMSDEERAMLGKNARRYAEENYDVNLLADRFHDMLTRLISAGTC